MIHRMDPPQDPGRQPLPEGLEPMLATPGPLPADEEAYGFEILWDGLRALAYAEGGRVRLEGDGVQDLGDTFPEVRPLGAALGATQAVLDGELVVLGDGGRPDRGRAGGPAGGRARGRRSGGRRSGRRWPTWPTTCSFSTATSSSTCPMPSAGPGCRASGWPVRRGRCRRSTSATAGRSSGLARRQGLPGVVAKRLDSPYVPGARSEDWIEVPGLTAHDRRHPITAGVRRPPDAAPGPVRRKVPPVGFEPTHPPPEGGALSPELRGPTHSRTILPPAGPGATASGPGATRR